jgi:exonuclease III
MIGLIWNGTGLGEYEKSVFLKESISEHKLDFICVQETKKEDFTDTWLNNISGRYRFIWLWEPPIGASGGLLMGSRDDKFDVFSCSSSRYLSHMVLMDRETKFKWNLVNVYGASKYSEKVLS